ncbi:vitamin D3 receptor-like [Saccostrea echinata]|uniref:vitamin D3 receptor-like n=1 Tax=Saccostrea echinata TaxID=191078 RepID=UPI002A7F62A6|nr:vitamin D3 receptor-like [Saccostrea echinata]
MKDTFLWKYFSDIMPSLIMPKDPPLKRGDVKKKVSKRLGQKREKYLPESLPLLLPPCKICGKKASGIHYGVNTCEACKGFFRRYLKRKDPYICGKGWNCDLESKSKGPHCSACRMKKCLALGMSKEGVRQGRYTLTERTNRIIAFKKSQEMEGDEWDSCSSGCNPAKSIIKDCDSGYNPDRPIKSEIDGSQTDVSCGTSSGTDSLSEHLHSTFYDNCSKHSMSLELSSLTKHSGDSPGDYSSAESACSPPGKCSSKNPDSPEGSDLPDVQEVVETLVKAYKHLQHFTQSISDEEIKNRLEVGYARHKDKIGLFGKLDPIPTKEYNEIYEKTNIDVDSRTQNSSTRREEFGLAMADYVAFSNEIPGFNELSARDKANLVKASRLDFFLILEYRAKDPETEMMISYSGRAVHLSEACAYLPKDLLKSWWNLTYDLRKLQLTTEEHAVLLALCLMSTDRCKVESPETVQKIESVLVNTITALLKSRYKGRAGYQFSAFINLLTKLRGISEEYHAVYRKICEDKVLIARAPELLAMLFDE